MSAKGVVRKSIKFFGEKKNENVWNVPKCKNMNFLLGIFTIPSPVSDEGSLTLDWFIELYTWISRVLFHLL